jgi:hypothetical protein
MPGTPSIYAPLIPAPGKRLGYSASYNMIALGGMLRDNWLYDFPIMPEATFIFQEMSSGREYKVAGSARGTTRAIEYLNNTTIRQTDGITFRGFDDYMRRQALDYLTVGRMITYLPEKGPMEYLDPTITHYNYAENIWYSQVDARRFLPDEIRIEQPLSIGSQGAFMSPLAPIMPAAMLSWLVREHDKASLDGRKVRDVFVFQNKTLAESVTTAVEQMIKSYTEPNVTSHSVPVVYADAIGDITVPTADLFARIGISEIPNGFDRDDFTFFYVNEIAAALGLALRHFWNSEKATNRALEEVQEARQAQKGPSYFVRMKGRMLNNSGVLKRFGPSIRMAFDEEVDVQSRESNARVLKLYADAALAINQLAPGLINVGALLGFLQRDDILPADIELFSTTKPRENDIQESDPTPTPDNPKVVAQAPTAPTKPSQKSLDLDYDEVVMDSNGKVLERRTKVFSIEKAIRDEMLQDTAFMEQITFEEQGLNLATAYQNNLDALQKASPDTLQKLSELFEQTDITRLQATADVSKLNDDDQRLLATIALNVFLHE